MGMYFTPEVRLASTLLPSSSMAYIWLIICVVQKSLFDLCFDSLNGESRAHSFENEPVVLAVFIPLCLFKCVLA